MKKSALLSVFLTIFLVLFLSIVSAANETTTSGNTAEKAYACLEAQIKDKTTASLSLQEAIFGTLALGSKKNLDDRINEDKGTDCWPKSACKIKETAQVQLAYKRVGKDAKNIDKWLISKNGSAPELTWYLEMDIQNHEAGECTLRYDGSERKININEDMTLSGSPGTCFSISASGYWLSIKESCMDKEFTISCTKDFVTALLYEKKNGGTIYVSPDTHSQAALGTTTERVNSKCLKDGSSCDYEGTLWGAFALQKAGYNIDAYLPYLSALSENNKRYFPSAFIYALTGGEDQYSEIIQNQKQGRSWEIVASPYNQFYDTSLGMLALGGSKANELEVTRSYLLGIQGASGCWNNNNIRDTAFLLYAGWPKASITREPSSGGSSLCEEVSSQSCEIGNECIGAGGRILSNFECVGAGVCCSLQVPEKSCQSQSGVLCSDTQQCDGRIANSNEAGVCCLDACVNKPVPEESTCEEIFEGSCKSACGEDEEEEGSAVCSFSGDVCCLVKQESTGINWILILIIGILLVLAVIGYLNRHKLQIWWYRWRGNAKVSPVMKPGNSGSAMTFGERPAARFAPPQYRAPPQRPAAPNRPAPALRRPTNEKEKDKEMEETLRKLREMSK